MSILVGLAGPLGTYAQLPGAVRVAYWGLVLGSAAAVARLCRRVLRPWLVHHGLWVRGGIGSALLATVFAPIVALANGKLSHWTGMAPMPLTTLWLATFLSSIVETAVWSVMRRPDPPVTSLQDGAPDPAATLSAASPAAPPPRLLARLEPALQGEIRSLSMRDHYVVVTTDRGRGDVLLRFADALEELGEIPGLRVHRSHWAATAAMERIERDSARLFLRLVDGQRLPISRSYREVVLALGLPEIERIGTALGGEPSSTARASARISAESAGSVQDSPPV